MCELGRKINILIQMFYSNWITFAFAIPQQNQRFSESAATEARARSLIDI